MPITIELPKSDRKDGVVSGVHTRVYNSETGAEITGIRNIQVAIAPDDIVTATVEVCVNNKCEMKNIHALLGTKTLDDILKLHGLK